MSVSTTDPREKQTRTNGANLPVISTTCPTPYQIPLVIVGWAAITLALAPLYGVLPLGTLLANGIEYIPLGVVECMQKTNSWLGCPLAGLPGEYRLVFGLPMAMLATALQRLFGTDALAAYNLAGLMFLFAGVASMWGLLRLMGATRFWSFAGTLLFYSLSIVWGKNGYGFMMWGFVFFPASIAATALHWRWARPLSTALLLTVVLTLHLFQEPYSFVMALIFGAIYAAIHWLYLWKTRWADALLKSIGWGLAIVVAILLYKLYVPGGADYSTMPMSFFRGQGIDLIAFTARPTLIFLLDLPWGVQDLNPLQFFTDGEAVYNSYLGIGFIGGIILFLAYAGVRQRPQLMALVIIAATALLLALGPSLKIDSQRAEEVQPPIQEQHYFMPSSAAVSSLPHAFVYKLPGIKAMRAVSRWYLLASLCIVVMVTLGLSSLSRRGRGGAVAATACAIWIAAEYAPDYGARAEIAATMRASFDRFNTRAVDELQKLLKPGEKVLFLGVGGPKSEYLTLYFCAMVDCRTFSASGDKNLQIAMKQWSPLMVKAFNPGVPEPDRAAAAAELVRKGEIDALVLVNYDLRWDSYTWDPPPDKVVADAGKLLAPFAGMPGLSIRQGTYYSVVRKFSDSSNAASTKQRAASVTVPRSSE